MIKHKILGSLELHFGFVKKYIKMKLPKKNPP